MKIEQKAFLKLYKPEDQHITNWGEYNLVAKVFDLRTLDRKAICDVRDEVVVFYDGLMDSVREQDRAKFWDYNTAMMSVTAVIDDFKWKIGAAI